MNEHILMKCKMIGHGIQPSVTQASPPRVNMHINFMTLSYLLKRAPQSWLFSLLCFEFSCAQR